MKSFLALLVFMGALNASAKNAVVTNCEGLTDIDYVMEPWQSSTRTFANGKVRVIHVDTYGEPVCCSSRMLVLLEDPNAELPGVRKCFAIAQDSNQTGFVNLNVMNIKSSYDAGKGLLLDLPVSLYSEDGNSKGSNVKVRINMGKASVTIE